MEKNHKGLERLYRTGSTKGVNPNHAPKLKRQLARLDAAQRPQDIGKMGDSQI
jgi:proteic killer suppression protein